MIFWVCLFLREFSFCWCKVCCFFFCRIRFVRICCFVCFFGWIFIKLLYFCRWRCNRLDLIWLFVGCFVFLSLFVWGVCWLEGTDGVIRFFFCLVVIFFCFIIVVVFFCLIIVVVFFCFMIVVVFFWFEIVIGLYVFEFWFVFFMVLYFCLFELILVLVILLKCFFNSNDLVIEFVVIFVVFCI